jgi:hypothetical protein
MAMDSTVAVESAIALESLGSTFAMTAPAAAVAPTGTPPVGLSNRGVSQDQNGDQRHGCLIRFHARWTPPAPIAFTNHSARPPCPEREPL